MHTDLQTRSQTELLLLAVLFGCRPEELTDDLMEQANREREVGRPSLRSGR